MYCDVDIDTDQMRAVASGLSNAATQFAAHQQAGHQESAPAARHEHAGMTATVREAVSRVTVWARQAHSTRRALQDAADALAEKIHHAADVFDDAESQSAGLGPR